MILEIFHITAMRRSWICPDYLTTNYEINVMGYVLFLIKQINKELINGK